MKKFFKTLIVLTGTSLGFAVARLIVDIIQTYYADIVPDQGYCIRPALYAGLMNTCIPDILREMGIGTGAIHI